MGLLENSGKYTTPKLYTTVVNRNGTVLLDNKTQTKKALSPQSAYVLYQMLKGPVSAEGTGSNANLGDMPVSGKTGTSEDRKDLWFVGLTPYYSAAVWIGNDDDSVLDGSLSSNSAAQLWANIMSPFHQGLEAKDIEMPDGVVTSPICSKSGKLPVSDCHTDPTGNKVYTEYFIDGTVPSDYCNVSHSWNALDNLPENKSKKK
jgi:penicillin-binding protein 1A